MGRPEMNLCTLDDFEDTKYELIGVSEADITSAEDC